METLKDRLDNATTNQKNMILWFMAVVMVAAIIAITFTCVL